MNQAVGAVSADLKMMLQLMMEIPLVIAAFAARVVVLHVRVAQGRAVTLVIRVRTGHRDRRRKLVHARGLLMVHHLLLLLLNSAGGRRLLLLLLLLAGLPLGLVAALAAGVPEAPAVGLILPLATETATRRSHLKKRREEGEKRETSTAFYTEDLRYARNKRKVGSQLAGFGQIVMLIASLLFAVTRRNERLITHVPVLLLFRCRILYPSRSSCREND